MATCVVPAAAGLALPAGACEVVPPLLAAGACDAVVPHAAAMIATEKAIAPIRIKPEIRLPDCIRRNLLLVPEGITAATLRMWHRPGPGCAPPHRR